jgi:succinoglycan biosynthesis protein ExoA
MTSVESRFDIAIVMPVLNEAKYLGQTLEQIYRQDFPMDRVEIVIADGGSMDGTRAIAESFRDRFGSLKVLDNPGRRPSSGRNVGVRNSMAPYVLVLDGHTYIPSRTLLSDMLALFRTTEAKCLCRAQPLMPPDINEFEMAVALCRASRLGHNPSSDIFSENEGVVDPTSSGAMYDRTVFEQLGSFDENFDACEDVDFNYRLNQAGHKAVISPKLKVFYYPRSTLNGLWRQMVRYGKGRFRLAWKHDRFSVMQWLAAAGILGLGTLAVVSLFSNAVFDVLRVALASYVLVVLFSSLYVALTRRHLGCLLYGPLIYPVIHFGLGIGFLSEAAEHYLKK